MPCVLFVWLGMAHAQTANLSGRVISAAEPRMEGVLVSAKKTGSNITHTVVSDVKGQFTFAAAKLGAGRYAITIRAVGYELEAPIAADAGVDKPLELKLIKAKDLASQLTNSEWFISMPGSFEQKRPLSVITSWGEIVLRGKSYSVISTRVARPLGRGSVLNGYCHWPLLRFTVAR